MHIVLFVLAALFSTTSAQEPLPALETRQSNQIACSYAKWTYNSLGDSPCSLLAKLGAKCDANFTVIPLTAETKPYPSPEGFYANDCLCSVVAYNLMAACSWCQPGIYSADWIPESAWQANCPNYASAGLAVNATDIQIPSWAFNPNNGDLWGSYRAFVFASSDDGRGRSASRAVPSSTSFPALGGNFASTALGNYSGHGATSSPGTTGATSLTSDGMPTASATAFIGIAIGVVCAAAILISIATTIAFLLREKKRKRLYSTFPVPPKKDPVAIAPPTDRTADPTVPPAEKDPDH